MGAVLLALGTMGAVVCLGIVLGRRGTLGERASAVLARVVFTIATPALLMTTVAHADLHLLLSRSALSTWLTTSVVALLAVVVLRLVLRRSAADVTVGTLASSYVNAGNLGLPLAVYLLGSAVAVVPALLFQLLVLAPVAFTVLDAHRARVLADQIAARTDTAAPDPLARRDRVSIALQATVRRTLTNPIIVGVLTGLVLAALPWDLPEEVYGPFVLVGATAAPLALLTFGMSLAVRAADRERAPRADLVLAVTLRTLVHPALAALVATALGLHGEARLAVVAMAALPTAQNVLVYAIQYGRGEALARDAGLVTTVLAVPVLLVVTAVL